MSCPFRIIVVEDQLIVTRDLKNRLAELGYETVADTTHAEEAITLVEKLRPDLILMDIRLAGEMDGIEAACIIRERFALPVVFLTAHAEETTFERAKAAEPYGYIIKPFEDRELRAVVEMALHKHLSDRRVRSSEARMKAILRTAMDGFILLNLQGRILEVNKAACDMVGYDQEEMHSMSLLDIDKDLDVSEMQARIANLRAKGNTRFERFYRHKSGRILKVEVSANFLPEDQGRVFCFLRDITESSQAQEALRRSQFELAEAQRIAHVGSWQLELNPADPLRSCLFWSEEVFRIFGREPGSIQVTPTALLDAVHPDDRELALAAFRSAVAGASECRFEHRVVRPDGEHRVVMERGEIQRTPDGVPVRVIGTVQDITDLRRSQEALDSMRYIVDHSGDAILWSDEDGRLVYVNRAACDLLGRAQPDLLKQSVYDIAPEFTKAQFQSSWSNLRAGKRPVFEGVLMSKNGRRFPVEVRLDLVRHRGVELICGFIQDISVRKAAELALQQREAELSAIYEHAPMIMCLLDGEGRVVRLNRVGRSFAIETGGNFRNGGVGDVMGCVEAVHNSQGCGHGNSCEECVLRSAVRETIETGGSRYNVESHHPLVRNGNVQDCYVQSHTARLNIGDQLRVLLCIEDVTKRKAAEIRLAETSNLLRVLLSNLQAGTLVEDESRQLLHVNQRLCQLFGVSDAPERLLGTCGRSLARDAQALFADPEKFLDRTDQLIQVGKPMTSEELLLRDGRVFARDYTPIVLGPARRAHLWTYRDVSNDKMTDRRLRQQATLLDVARDAILLVDLAGNLQYANGAAREWFGVAGGEVTGQMLEHVMQAKSELQCRVAMKEVQQGGEWAGELTLKGPQGKERVVSSRWCLIKDSADGASSVLIMCNDITDKKQLETQYLRAQRLESVGTLASGVAHDLNNVLSPILMGLEVLKESASSQDDRSILRMMHESALRGKDTVRQLLTFSRGAASQKGPVQLRHLLKEVVRLLQQTFPKNIQIYSDWSGTPFTVLADPSQLHQILMNLCVNARDAMPNGGVLSLTLENQELDASSSKLHPRARPGRYAVVKVADSGVGIAPEVMERIFDPFFTTKPRGQGTGLGLATTLGIVENHGGFVSVESTVGSGSTFTVYLPAAGIENASLSIALPQDLPRGDGELILVVDDEVAILRVAEAVLARCGYAPISASSAAEATDLFRKNKEKIKLVLTDVMMPFGDGRELISTLREIDPDVRVIAMSGHGTPDTKSALERSGARAFLSKPFTAQDLQKVLGEILRNPMESQPNH
jgi:PAS domain S-box-containing protein